MQASGHNAAITGRTDDSIRLRAQLHFTSCIQRGVHRCKMNGVEPYAYLRDLFTRLANGHLAKDIDALLPWAYAKQTSPHNDLIRDSPVSSQHDIPAADRTAAIRKTMGRKRRLR